MGLSKVTLALRWPGQARPGDRLPHWFAQHQLGRARNLDVSTTSPCPPRAAGPRTHPLVDVLPAGLILLLHALLQEVDAQLEAEVLLLQVIEVLGQSAISIRHGGQPMGRSTCPIAPSAQERGAAAPRHEASRRRRCEATATCPWWLARSPALGPGLAALGAGAQRAFLFYLGRYLRNPWQRNMLRELRHKWCNPTPS